MLSGKKGTSMGHEVVVTTVILIMMIICLESVDCVQFAQCL